MTPIKGSTAAPDGSQPTNGWKIFPALPDPVGFGGMFSGVLNGRLMTGGGSQFRDKPLWLNGEKTFSDRVFTLTDPSGAWAELSFRLPFKIAHAANASTAEAIYLVGGIGASGCVSAAWEIRMEGDSFTCMRLPDFPHTVGYAAAAIVGNRLYVAGGQNSATIRVASVETWSLDLQNKNGWRREPDLPEDGVFLAAAASCGAYFYVFGGVNFDTEGKAIQSAQTWRLHVAAEGRWERLTDMAEPRVGAATPCAVVGEGKIFLIGGYARSFSGAPRDHPGFDQQTYLYDIARECWENGPLLPKAEVEDRDRPGEPGPAPMIAAPGAVWLNHAVVVSGEVRASTRTPTVLAWPLDQFATC